MYSLFNPDELMNTKNQSLSKKKIEIVLICLHIVRLANLFSRSVSVVYVNKTVFFIYNI